MSEILSAEDVQRCNSWTAERSEMWRRLDSLYRSHEALRACLAEAEAERVEWHQAYESADDRAKVAVMRAEAAEARLVEVEAEREAARSNVAHWSAEWSTRLRAAEARLAEVEQALRDVEPLIEWLAERAEDWAPEAEEAAQEGIARLRAVLDKGEQG